MQYIPCCPPNIRENYLNCNIRFNEFSVININFTNVKRPKIRASLHIVLGSNKSAGTHNCSKLCITQFLLHSNLIIWFKMLPFWKSVIFQKSIYPKWNHKMQIDHIACEFFCHSWVFWHLYRFVISLWLFTF